MYTMDTVDTMDSMDSFFIDFWIKNAEKGVFRRVFRGDVLSIPGTCTCYVSPEYGLYPEIQGKY